MYFSSTQNISEMVITFSHDFDKMLAETEILGKKHVNNCFQNFLLMNFLSLKEDSTQTAGDTMKQYSKILVLCCCCLPTTSCSTEVVRLSRS